MARVAPAENRNADETDLIARAKKYSFLKSQLDYLEKEQKALRAELFEVLDLEGEEDDKGNIVIELPEEVDGYNSIIKQRRVSRKIDETRAEELITEKSMEDTLYKTIRVVDEDAVMAALYTTNLQKQKLMKCIHPQLLGRWY